MQHSIRTLFTILIGDEGEYKDENFVFFSRCRPAGKSKDFGKCVEGKSVNIKKKKGSLFY
jgi:hypothetical protein